MYVPDPTVVVDPAVMLMITAQSFPILWYRPVRVPLPNVGFDVDPDHVGVYDCHEAPSP